MLSSSRKPYTAVTVQIDRLTSEQFEEDDMSGIIDLIEVVRLQASGPTEAARAIRKKLKYGNSHRQLRALTILDGLIQNAGSRFQRAFADEPLLERLRLMSRDDMVDVQVRNKCNVLFRQWAVTYKDTAGMSGIASLYKQLPQKKRAPQPSRVLRETEADAQSDPFAAEDDSTPSEAKPSPASFGHSRQSSGLGASASSPRPITLPGTPHFSATSKPKSKKDKHNKFSLEKEKPNIMQSIAAASVASTNLLNVLQLINRETTRVSENAEVLKRFETCKSLRRQILRYIQLVESDEWIGSLISANEELVKALRAYEIMDKSLEDDSDSDAWERPPAEEYIAAAKYEQARLSTQTEAQLQNLHINDPSLPSPAAVGLKHRAAPPPPKPPRPASVPMSPSAGKARVVRPDTPSEDGTDEEEDPFGDANAVTPQKERSGMTWRDV